MRVVVVSMAGLGRRHVFMKHCDAVEVPDSTQYKQPHHQHAYCYPPIVARTPPLLPQIPVPVLPSSGPIPQSPALVSPDCHFIPGQCSSHSPSGHFNFSQPLPPVTMSHQPQMNNHAFVFSSPPGSFVSELFPALRGINPNHDGFSSPNPQTLPGSLRSPHRTADSSSQISPVQSVPTFSSSPTSNSTLKLHHYPFESPCLDGSAVGVPDHMNLLPMIDSPGFQVDGGVTSTEQVPGSVYIPPSAPNPGEYGFKLYIDETTEATTTSPWLFSRDLNTIFVRPWSDFAVTFKFEKPCPPNCYVRTMVCYKEPGEVKKHGPITKCLKHLSKDKDSEHGDHFVLSKAADAVYREHTSHRCVTVPVDTMAVSEHGRFAVFSYTCFSSCIVGNGKKKPRLVTIFSLIASNGQELARDVVTVRICACPFRDMSKVLAPAEDASPSSRHRRGRTASKKDEVHVRERSPGARPGNPTSVFGNFPIHPALDLTDGGPDKDGYYTFIWRTKDKGVYNTLLMMKSGYEAMASV